MLSEERKSILETEEHFRHELKSSFEGITAKINSESKDVEAETKVVEKKLGSKYVDFLKSSLGMWFLSSVVLTGSDAAFQRMQHHYDLEEKIRHNLYFINLKSAIEFRI